jgi:hypothetical protein
MPRAATAATILPTKENIMNRHIATGLILLAGVAIGATAIEGLHAQARRPMWSSPSGK